MRVYGPQLSEAAQRLLRAYEPQVSEAAQRLLRADGLQLSEAAQRLLRADEPRVIALFALQGHNAYSPDSVENAPSPRQQKLSDREIGAILTVTAFLFVYFSLSLLVKHNPQAAEIAATDGPTPFEVAMAIGALVFWLWMNRSGRSNGK